MYICIFYAFSLFAFHLKTGTNVVQRTMIKLVNSNEIFRLFRRVKEGSFNPNVRGNCSQID